MTVVADMIKYSRFVFGLRDFLRGTISLEQSIQAISERIKNRERNFLSLIQKGVYQNPKSPYLKLLNVVGCEFEDIKYLVVNDGIEATLNKLLAEGVYVSWEEFKGKKDIVRGGNHFQFRERDFDNPFLPVYYQVQSGGSRSAGTRTIFDLSHQLEKSYYSLPALAVNNALDFPIGIWHAIPPSGTGIGNLLRWCKMGKPVVKWFSPVNESQVHASLQHRLATRYIIYGSRFWGAKLVKPEYASFSEAVKVAQWIANTRKQFGGCSFRCSVSPAVKICQAAIENGLDIQETRFFSGGEPLTAAKRRQIESSGALITPVYTINEIGRIGYGCPGGHTADDVHLFHDSVALIQHRRKVEHTDIQVDAFVFTSLLPTAPKILLNVESDDYGVMETGNCGCLFEQLGFHQHLNSIRSFAKLTGIGVTILGSDFVRILEEVLPHKYGGATTDYQLLEEEDSRGQTHLSLIISPKVGAIDDNEVIATVLSELGRANSRDNISTKLWAQADMLQIKRMDPIANGWKIMTLHMMKKEGF